MSYTITFSDEAQEHLGDLAARNRKIVLSRIRAALIEEPTKETRNLKLLRTNPLARYELRIGNFRVFFDPSEDEKTVRILAVGRKQGNKLIIGGKEVSL